MSATITEKETAVSTTTATPKSIRPLSYTNLLANSSNYLKHGSSSESLDSQVSNASTIKFTASSVSPTISPSPQTPQVQPQSQVQSQVRKKIQIPNYYVPPKVNIAPSISITESNDATNTTETIARPSLIRKKSGEIVKSSLKLSSLLQRSLSTPQLSTMGNKGSTRKSVRFASRLANVKTFDGCDSPSTVSLANSPCTSPPCEFESGFEDVDVDDDVYTFLKNKPNRRLRLGFEWNWDKLINSSSSSSDDDENEDDYWSTPKQFSKPNKFLPNSGFVSGTTAKTITTTGFNSNSLNSSTSAPSKEYRLTSHNIPKMINSRESIVWLPSAYVLKTDGKTFLYGLVNVQNLAFEKKVFLKLTLNNWKTSVIFGGQSVINYFKSIDNKIDQFKFKISLDDLISSDGKNVQLQMCIKYQVNDTEYWDNNFGKNYQFQLTRIDRKVINNISSSTSVGDSKTVATTTTTAKKDDEFPQFNELVSKLMLHQQDTQIKKKTSPVAQRSFSVFNNFEELNSGARLTVSSSSPRPFLNKSFSSNDIIGSSTTSQQRPRYSQRHQRSHRKDATTTTTNTNTTTSSLSRPDFSSLSYADLLNNYCFANSSTTTTNNNPLVGVSSLTTSSNTSSISTSPVASSTTISSISSSTPNTPILTPTCLAPPQSTASTFHSFSDSIHI